MERVYSEYKNIINIFICVLDNMIWGEKVKVIKGVMKLYVMLKCVYETFYKRVAPDEFGHSL